MSPEMRIQDALAKLAEGKFCFRMSDCIAEHIATQSQKIEALTISNDQCRMDILQRDLHIHLLEKEVTHLRGTLSGARQMQALLSQAIEGSSKAKEKVLFHGLPLVQKNIAEAWSRLVLFWGEAELMIEKGRNDIQPQFREIAKFLEKVASDLFRKIKAAA